MQAGPLRKYGITELEALGLCGQQSISLHTSIGTCVLYMDHSTLKVLLKARHPSGKLARWSQALCEFVFGNMV